MIKFIIGALAATALMLGGFFVGQTYYTPATTAQKTGNFNTTGGGTYNLQATITSNQTTIQLSSFLEPQSNIPYTMSYLNSSIEYATIAPQTSTSEFISFTGITQNSDGSATLTGVQRGLDRSYPYTASTTLALPHAGQTRLILSNPPQVYNSYAALTNNNIFYGTNTFSSTSPAFYDADPIWTNFPGTIFADFNYVNSVVAAGAANGSETVKGVYQLATAAQAAIGASVGSTGARLVLGANLATTTPLFTGTNVIPVTGTNQKLSQLFLDLTQAFTFANNVTVSGTTTLSSSLIGSSTIGTLNSTSTAIFDGSVFFNGSVTGASGKFYTNTSPGSIPPSGGTGSTTIFASTIPANTLSTSNFITYRVYMSAFTIANTAGGFTMEVGYGTGTTSINIATPASVAYITNGGVIEISLLANGSTGSQILTVLLPPTQTTQTETLLYSATLSQDSTLAKQLTMIARFPLSASSQQISPIAVTGILSK